MFLTQINNYRAENGLGTLILNDKLDDVARWMANDLATNNYFSHTDSLGRDPFQRTDNLGSNTWRGENLAAGTQASVETFQLWHDSPPHHENMLDPHYTAIGIGRAYSASSAFGWYWVTEFAGEDGPTSPPRVPAATAEAALLPVNTLAPATDSSPADTASTIVMQTEPATPPPLPVLAPQPTASPKAVELSRPAHSGLLIEGVPPTNLGGRTGGSFLSALLELAPAVDRALSRESFRLVD